MTNKETNPNVLCGFTGRRRLYLMRHGHVDYFAPGLTDPRGVPLTERGQEQAKAVRDALSKVNFDFACCSGLPRTVQTAQIILSGQDHQAPQNPQDPEGNKLELIENLEFEELKSGWIQVDNREELAARLAFCFDGADIPGARFLPDGEKFEDARKRIVAGLNHILTSTPWKTGLLVAHEGVNRIILSWIMSQSLACVNAIEQDLCAVNVIDFDIVPTPKGDGVEIERAVLKMMNATPYDIMKIGLPYTSLEHLFDVDFGASRPAKSQA